MGESSQTNGKVEKWFDYYGHHRGRMILLKVDQLVYTDRMRGRLNMRYAETLNPAFIKKNVF